MNVAALKRVDPYVKDILETATHVALYTFNADDNEWEKTDVEGALFVYSRNGEPYHSILIMNRLNTNNLVEPVIQGLDLQLREPFLLYRNSSCRIFGVWFYNKEECIRIAAVLDKLVKESEMSKKFPEKVSLKNKCSTSGTNVDIFTMLSRAQEDYNSGKNQANIMNAPAKESKPEMPQGVVDFFAKASSGTSHFPSDKVSQPVGIYVGHHQSRATVTELPSDASDGQLKPLLQHLIPNPVHTVEQIEKQQRSATPQIDAVSTKKSKGKTLPIKDNSKQNSSGNLKARPVSSGGLTDGIKAQHGSVLVTQLSSSTSLGLVENGMSFLRIASPTTTCPKLTPFFGTGFQTVSSGMVMDVNTPDQRPLSAPLCSGTETSPRPALMPPTMFTSSVKNGSDKLEAGNTTVQVHNSDMASVKPTSELPVSTLGTGTSGGVLLDGRATPVRPEPLTRNQLLQAFNYLVKNDPEFVNKLHEAYVKSFAEMVM
jgi:mRNA-decapping enzyme 1B